LLFLIRFRETYRKEQEMERRGFVGTIVAVAALAAALVAPASALAFQPLASFGSDGEGAGQLSAPGAMATGPDGSLYVVDHGNDRVAVFSPTDEFRYAFGQGVRPGGGDVCDAGSGCQAGSGGEAAGALEGPEGIAISNSGEVYVGEEGNERVSVFSANGVFQFAFGYHVGPGDSEVCTAESGCVAGSNLRVPEDPSLFTQVGPEGALAEPTGVAIDASGRVFVTEAGNNRVSVFDLAGKFLYMFGLEVEGEAPFGNVCTGNPVGCIEANPFAGGGISEPRGIAKMPDGSLAISDTGNQRLLLYTPEGEFLRAFGHEVAPAPGGDICSEQSQCRAGEGEGAGALAEPAGIVVDSSGWVSVGDPGLERVSEFAVDGRFLLAFGAGVRDGSPVFQVCTALSGCRAGLQLSSPGATPHPFGVAAGCGGAVLVSESTAGLARVERFGETGAAVAPCPTSRRPQPLQARLVPSNLFQLGPLKRDRKRGTATLSVIVPATGLLSLSGRGLRPVVLNVGSGATVALPLSLVGNPRQRLLTKGFRKVGAVVTFTPDGGTARTETRRLTLVKLPKARPKPRQRR
jgi:hypothetical protein